MQNLPKRVKQDINITCIAGFNKASSIYKYTITPTLKKVLRLMYFLCYHLLSRNMEPHQKAENRTKNV